VDGGEHGQGLALEESVPTLARETLCPALRGRRRPPPVLGCSRPARSPWSPTAGSSTPSTSTLQLGYPIAGPPELDAFEVAFTAARHLEFRYRDERGRSSDRCVEPDGLLVRQPLWYVIAWDVDRAAPRLFRADRISAPASHARTPYRP